ncbi:MAG: hypothetical protein AAGJ38_02430 [Planctomycetota bacterium]
MPTTSLPAIEFKDTARSNVPTWFLPMAKARFYVQHKMELQAAQFFSCLATGAWRYVCGDARGVARDVEGTLAKIVR